MIRIPGRPRPSILLARLASLSAGMATAADASSAVAAPAPAPVTWWAVVVSSTASPSGRSWAPSIIAFTLNWPTWASTTPPISVTAPS